MRIALAVEGTRGDVYPMLELGAALRARGHDPVLCAPPDFAPSAAARDLEYRPIGESVQGFLTLNAQAVAMGGRQLVQAIRAYMNDTLALQFGQLPEATRGADLVIGAGVQGAAGTAAELHGVPYRYVVYCPMVIPSAEHAPLYVPPRPLPSWANRLLWGLGRLVFNVGLRRPVNRHRRALGLAPVDDLYRYLLSPRPILAADAELAPAPLDWPDRIQQIPCLHPVDGTPLPAKLESFLEAGPPPVYLGFGSMTDPDPAATTRMLLEAVSLAGCRALISEGWAGLGEGPLPEGVLTLGPVSHAELFPRVALVVHHGGAGTTTTAARGGTPQLLVPHLLDQYYWAQRVQDLGVGLPPIHRKRLTATELAESLRAALDNEHLADRAARLGEKLRARAGSDPTPDLLDGSRRHERT